MTRGHPPNCQHDHAIHQHKYHSEVEKNYIMTFILTRRVTQVYSFVF